MLCGIVARNTSCCCGTSCVCASLGVVVGNTGTIVCAAYSPVGEVCSREPSAAIQPAVPNGSIVCSIHTGSVVGIVKSPVVPAGSVIRIYITPAVRIVKRMVIICKIPRVIIITPKR